MSVAKLLLIVFEWWDHGYCCERLVTCWSICVRSLRITWAVVEVGSATVLVSSELSPKAGRCGSEDMALRGLLRDVPVGRAPSEDHLVGRWLTLDLFLRQRVDRGACGACRGIGDYRLTSGVIVAPASDACARSARFSRESSLTAVA